MHLCHGSQRSGRLVSVFREPDRELLSPRVAKGPQRKGPRGEPPVRLSSCELGRLWMMHGSSLGRRPWVSGFV